MTAQEYADRLLDKQVTEVTVEGEFLRVEFSHRSTDDGAGCLAVPIAALFFCQRNPCASCWQEPTSTTEEPS